VPYDRHFRGVVPMFERRAEARCQGVEPATWVCDLQRRDARGQFFSGGSP